MNFRLSCALAVGAMALIESTAPPPAAAAGDPDAPSTPEEVLLPIPGSEDWQPLTFRGIDTPTEYTLDSSEDDPVVTAKSNCSASGLVLRLDAVHIDQTPLLSWRWRVDRGLDLRAENTQSEDDFAARVYIMFELDKERASTLQKIRHRLAKLIYGETIPGSALNFVWTSQLPEGEVWDNPFQSSAKMIALAQGQGAEWQTETVDVVAYYRQLFESPPPPLLGLAIMSDSDNSCQSATARFADFKFLPVPALEGRDVE
jgi:hypothetical protein